ncbi:MAG: DEAD/DEAH box helicase [Beijerinckiaceae bacterium]|nr:DEAD/DEAH box helicase [Beijerinckiaceae bacterium]
MSHFSDLGLAETLLRALREEGYDTPTPIQERAIPALLQGRDLLGIAQTGTGKTAAFALPIIHRLLANPGRQTACGTRVLILAPTRELVAQIADSFRAYGRHARITVAVIVGGVAHGPQVKAMARGVDVLVATPGRLLDHMSGGTVRLGSTEVIVLDEADHMLDLGFVVPIRKIIQRLPEQRQSLFFSATMPREIATLANEMLDNPVQVAVTPVATTAERVDQKVYMIEAKAKRDLLVELLRGTGFSRVIVFTRTKRGADKVADYLASSGIPAAAIHGNKSQGQRQRALAEFKDGRTGVLVATDIAARGIDVDSVSHVVNFELPDVPESYVHRIGRTARAGAEGIAISFCDNEERHLLRQIEKVTRQSLPVIDRRGEAARSAPDTAAAPADRRNARPAGRRPEQNRRPDAARNGRPGAQRRFGNGQRTPRQSDARPS